MPRFTVTATLRMRSALCLYLAISQLHVLKVFRNAALNSMTHPQILMSFEINTLTQQNLHKFLISLFLKPLETQMCNPELQEL